MPTIAVLGGFVVLVIGLSVVAGEGRPGYGLPVPADPAVVAEMNDVSTEVIDKVGIGGAASPLHPIAANPLTGIGRKSQILYVGAEWCGDCAAERWSLIFALMNFGSFSNLHFTLSSSRDPFPNVRTFTFFDSSYTSQYVDFIPVELQDRNHNRLETLSAEQDQLVHTYDANGDLPFVEVGNRYTMIGQGVPPDPLQGLTWQQIGADLSNPNSPVTKAIVGNANYLTAAICKLPGANTAPICSDTTIKQIATLLPGA